MGIELRVIVHRQTRHIVKRKLVRAAVHQAIADGAIHPDHQPELTQLEYFGLTFLPVTFSYTPRKPSVCMVVSNMSKCILRATSRTIFSLIARLFATFWPCAPPNFFAPAANALSR